MLVFVMKSEGSNFEGTWLINSLYQVNCDQWISFAADLVTSSAINMKLGSEVHSISPPPDNIFWIRQQGYNQEGTRIISISITFKQTKNYAHFGHCDTRTGLSIR
jgi:hypothetical protein